MVANSIQVNSSKTFSWKIFGAENFEIVARMSDKLTPTSSTTMPTMMTAAATSMAMTAQSSKLWIFRIFCFKNFIFRSPLLNSQTERRASLSKINLPTQSFFIAQLRWDDFCQMQRIIIVVNNSVYIYFKRFNIPCWKCQRNVSE